MLYQPGAEKLCLTDTLDSASSLSTEKFIPQPIPSKSHYVPNRLFIGGFPENTTSRELCSMFAPFGRILGCNIMHKELNRHYGFVTFNNLATAERVLDLYKRGMKFTIQGKTLKIRSAMFKPKKNVSSDGNSFGYLDGKQVITIYHKGTTYFKDLTDEYKKSSLDNSRYLPQANYDQLPVLPPRYVNPSCLTLPVNLIQNNSMQVNSYLTYICQMQKNSLLNSHLMRMQFCDHNHQINGIIQSYI